jgi:hypothetical protein
MAQRKRRPVEPIELHWDKTEDLKELMRGYFPHAAAVEAAPIGKTPVGVSPIGDIPIPETPVPETPEPAPGSAAPDATLASPIPPAGETPAPIPPAGIPPVGVSSVKTSRVYRCVLAQDAHTHSEEAVYQFLWRLGQSAPGGPDCRYASISLKQLSERIRMDPKSTQALLRRLIEKLTIELAGERDNHRQTARVWKVYSYAAILQRRRAAGLEWVMRNKGIHFVPEPPVGEEPTGETPTGETPQTPMGVTPPLSYIRKPLPDP